MRVVSGALIVTGSGSGTSLVGASGSQAVRARLDNLLINIKTEGKTLLLLAGFLE